MTDDQTTLSEFFERRAEEGDEPSPERNAADIEHLIGVVEDLAEDVGTLTEELESEDGTDGIDTKPTDATERMFQ